MNPNLFEPEITTGAPLRETIHPPGTPAQEPVLAPIWQWPSNWQCPMLGTGLSLAEQRRIFKRPRKTRRMGAYDLHQALMVAVGTENPISRRIDRLLRRRFQPAAAATESLAADEFMAIWRSGWQGAEGLGLFYVAAARCDLNENQRREIYGCVHMAGHVATGELLAARREADRQREASIRLARTVHQLREGAKRQGQRRRQQARTRPAAPKVHPRPLAGGPALDLRPLPAEQASVRPDDRLQSEVRRLRREKQKLEITCFELQSQNAILAGEVRGLLAQAATAFNCDGSCHSQAGRCEAVTSTCPRRILIVGGMTKLHHLYRDLVAAAGGELDYHDGYLRQGGDNLQARIGRSDLVICPVNCNSHNACKRVKGICKRLKKPLQILPSASLSAISAALHGPGAPGEPLSAALEGTVN